MTKLPLAIVLLPLALWRIIATINQFQGERANTSGETKLDRLMRLRFLIWSMFIISCLFLGLFLVTDTSRWLLRLCGGILVILGITLGYLSYRITLTRSGFG